MRYLVALALLLLASPAFGAKCLPPDVPDFITWPIVNADSRTITADSGPPGEVVIILYRQGQQVAFVVWLEGRIVAVDMAPDNPGSPAWLDMGYLTPAGKMRGTPGKPCSWKLVSRREA